MYSGNSYKNFPKFYDLLYQRYFKSIPDFIALVKKNTPKGGFILDLAAGTGEVTIPLLKNGFKVISLDLSEGMLKELKLKAKQKGIKNYHTISLDMQKVGYQDKFDSICIRQAINYFIGTKTLEVGLKNIFIALKKGGKFIFNAPNYQGEKEYPIISNYYEKEGLKAFVLEMNSVNKKLLKHKQYSIVWDNNKKPSFINDENSFYMFTKKEFITVLNKCGFSKLEFNDLGKTLYCIATK